MTTQEFADRLDGREYGNEITDYEHEQAKAAGFIVAFGYSDDNLELRGVAYDEVGAWNGTTAKVTSRGKVFTDEEAEEADKLIKSGWTPPKGHASLITIKAEWSPKEPKASWLITTDAPHSTFDIFEEGELFCRGVVIDTRGGTDAQT